MKKTSIYLGLSTKHGNPIRKDLVIILIRRLLSNLQGYTVTEAKGCWKDTSEDTLVITYFGNDDEDMHVLANVYKGSFHQDTVLIETSISEVKFI